MSNEDIKLYCDIEYENIRLANLQLERIRKQCKHERTELSNYLYRVGTLQKAEICVYCGTPVKFFYDKLEPNFYIDEN